VRYARALFDVTLAEGGDPVTTEQQLAGFVTLVDQHADLQGALANPAVPAASKRAVVQQLVDRLAPASPVTKILLLLADRDRLALLPEMLAAYRERLLEHQQVISAEVTTAIELPEARAAELADRLAKATGRTVKMTTRVDPTIIGGIVTRIGSTVYDGSVGAQLQAIRQRLAR
jgi:F-type H+-transporting ATPase subunit delta